MTQLIMAVVSACQVMFMISRAPKVPWEAIYLPLSEMITYTLAYFGHGYVLLASGKTLPWARMASWVCTCPIMLGMISNMALVKYKSQPLNPLMVAASLGRLTFGISATMSDGGTTLWCFFLLGISFFMLEYSTVYAIFGIAIDDFASVQSPLGDLVVHRLNILRGIFYFSWTAFPIIWLISHSCLCVVDENVMERETGSTINHQRPSAHAREISFADNCAVRSCMTGMVCADFGFVVFGCRCGVQEQLRHCAVVDNLGNLGE